MKTSPSVNKHEEAYIDVLNLIQTYMVTSLGGDKWLYCSIYDMVGYTQDYRVNPTEHWVVQEGIGPYNLPLLLDAA